MTLTIEYASGSIAVIPNVTSFGLGRYGGHYNRLIKRGHRQVKETTIINLLHPEIAKVTAD